MLLPTLHLVHEALPGGYLPSIALARMVYSGIPFLIFRYIVLFSLVMYIAIVLVCLHLRFRSYRRQVWPIDDKGRTSTSLTQAQFNEALGQTYSAFAPGLRDDCTESV